MASEDRYIADNEGLKHAPDVKAELMASLERIYAFASPEQSPKSESALQGFYKGPTSIAYLFYRLSILYPGVEFKGQVLQQWAIAYLKVFPLRATPVLDPDHCGIASEVLAHTTLQAVIYQYKHLARGLCGYHLDVLRARNSGSNEWLYGKAGYLYFLRLLRSGFDEHDHPDIHELIVTTIRRVIQGIMQVPSPWKWHGKEYLGAAHGTIGIITQAVLSDPGVAPYLSASLLGTLLKQLPSGNFAAAHPADAEPHAPAGSDILVQYCHGAPGFVLSLESIMTYFDQMRGEIESCMSAARRVVLERGILTKEACLCHGVAGNALVVNSEQDHVRFLSYMTTAKLRETNRLPNAGSSDDAFGLYTGEAGRAWCWAMADLKMSNICIGYNDI